MMLLHFLVLFGFVFMFGSLLAFISSQHCRSQSHHGDSVYWSEKAQERDSLSGKFFITGMACLVSSIILYNLVIV